MKRAVSPVLALACLCLPLAAGPAGSVEIRPRPVVVELFTSQGCYSCPPADRFLGTLAKRRDVIALSFHVDYWNYLGWDDPFAHRWSTVRQRAYAWAMKRASVYTPQMVIDGRWQAIGSKRDAVTALVRRARDDGPPPVRVSLERLAGDRLEVSVAPGASRSADMANIWLALFDKARTTDIPRGENAGKRLTYHHVVREFRMIGDYAGKPVTMTVSTRGEHGAAAYYGAAVLVQMPRGGRVIGAARSLAAAPPASARK